MIFDRYLRAQQVPRRHVRPRVERPGLLSGPIGLVARVAQRLLGELARDVGVEGRDRIAVIDAGCPCRLREPGVRRPVVALLARQQHHPGDEHQEADRQARAQERGGEAAERLRHDDQLGALADRLDHRVRVLPQPGRVVLARQVRSDGVVAARLQLGDEQVPEERAVAASVDQDVGGDAANVPPARS